MDFHMSSHSYELLINTLANFFRKFIKILIETWDPRWNEDFLHVTIPRSNHLSDFIEFISKWRGRGGFELDSRSDIFKQFPDMNWLTQIEHQLKISIGFSLKSSAPFVPVIYFINAQISMNRRNSLNSISGPLIILLVPARMTSSTKVSVRKRKNDVR